MNQRRWNVPLQRRPWSFIPEVVPHGQSEAWKRGDLQAKRPLNTLITCLCPRVIKNSFHLVIWTRNRTNQILIDWRGSNQLKPGSFILEGRLIFLLQLTWFNSYLKRCRQREFVAIVVCCEIVSLSPFVDAFNLRFLTPQYVDMMEPW